MACPCNQGKINALKKDIARLKSLIEECESIMYNHLSFKRKINCVINNMINGDNHTDNTGYCGKKEMEECLNLTNKTIDDAENIIKECNRQISFINKEIDGLQGDCSKCASKKRRNNLN